MSRFEGDNLEEPEFKWLKEKIDGKRHREIHFYESFVYDGVEYSLYDSVYLQAEYEQPHHIGKLVKIWEEANKSKKVRVQWFFRPSEILYYLGDTEVLENELFLASGCGTGLVNIIPLESIVGKCNVVCISNDDRNPKASEDEKKMAEYVFYRIFDVQNFMISDQLTDTIGQLEVKFVFNREESLRTPSNSKYDSNDHDTKNAITFKDTTRLVNSQKNFSTCSSGDCNHMVGKKDANAKQVYVAREDLLGDMDNESFVKVPTSRGKCTIVSVNSSEEATTNIIDKSSSGGGIVGCKTKSEGDKVKGRNYSLKPTESKENLKPIISHGLNETSIKRSMLYDTSSKDGGKNIDSYSSISWNIGASNDKNENKNVKHRKSHMKNACSGENMPRDNRSSLGGDIVGCKTDSEGYKVKERKSHLKPTESKEHVKSMKSLGLNETSMKSGMLDGTSSKDNEYNIDSNPSICWQATGTAWSKEASNDKNDGYQVSIKNVYFGEKVRADNRSSSGGDIVGYKTNSKGDKVIFKKSHLKPFEFEKNAKALKSRVLNETSMKRRMLDDTLLKDNGRNIDSNSSIFWQTTSITCNKGASNDKNDGCQVSTENKGVKYKQPHLKNASEQKVWSDTKSPCLEGVSLKRGKLEASSSEDGEIISNRGKKKVSCVKIVDGTRWKSGKLDDKSSSKDNGKTSGPYMIPGNNPMTHVKSGGLRKDVKETISPRKTLESDRDGFLSHQNNLKSTKCWSASTGKFSRRNGILVDESMRNGNKYVSESHGQVSKHIKLSSDSTSQSSKTRVHQSNGEINREHDSSKRKDLSLMKGFCLGDAPSKKAKLDIPERGKKDNMEVIPKLKEKSYGATQEMTNHARGACERENLVMAKDSCVMEDPFKETELDCSSKTSKLYQNDVFQNPTKELLDNLDGEVEGAIFEVIPMPTNEKRTWLKLGDMSWESMKTAHNEGKLVLLQNLDPTLTSAEVKDIIWHAFQEKCMAKMVQHTAMSCPHNGQALLIFDTREVAERVLKELDDKCLMLLDQRPLVGCTVLLPEYPRKQTTFVGHLSIDKVKRRMQREMKEAVSTSHYSQPNTIEYEMAMEWFLLQSKSKIWYQHLFEQHKVESRKLVANLQAK